MKTPARPLHLAAIASLLALTAAVWAQTPSTPADPPAAAPASTAPAAASSSTGDQSATPAAVQPTVAEAATPPPSAPAAASEQPGSPTAPAASAAPATEPGPAAPAPTPATTTTPANSTPASAATSESEMRRLDTPAAQPAEKPADEKAPAAPEKPSRPRRGQGNGDARVSIMHDSVLAADEHADAVVSILGSSTSAGTVGEAVVSILGSSTSSGSVGEAVVSILGETKITGGEVGEAAVAVLGNNYINAKVHGDVVTVLGTVELGPKAEIGGDIVCVGGEIQRDPGAIVHGNLNNVSVGFGSNAFVGIQSWVRHCLVLGRPLAFAPHLLWAWAIAVGALVLYVIFGLLFPRGIVRCAETFERRPGFSILTAFLVALLTPAAAILLLITVVGTPALIIGLIIATLFGKAVMLAWIGRRITLRFGDGPLAHPAFAVLIGGLIALLLYTIPFVGFVVAKLLSWLGTGVVVYTLIQSIKRPKPATPTAVPPAPGVATAGLVPPPITPAGSAGEAAATLGAMAPAVAAPPSATSVPASATFVSAAALPRAGFWIRIAASALDVLVVGVASHLLPLDRLPDWARPHFLVLVAAYCLVFWALRATTLGGIVCGLKVVRLDDRPVDWMTALVRVLGGFLSLFAAGVGFIWVAFDDQKQSWHDKIAGTTIVRVPKGVSLV